MSIGSLWTENDQKTLKELVRKRGFADVVLGLRDIAVERKTSSTMNVDWPAISGSLVKIYDAIQEGRKLP